jgi:hypothetical protein
MAGNPNPFGYDLRDEEQVKEYLDNIEIEYTFHCFGEKAPDGKSYGDNIMNMIC